jgi:signal transduction histidine kinase
MKSILKKRKTLITGNVVIMMLKLKRLNKSLEENIKILTIVFLSSFSVWLISYYTMVVKEEIFYTHFMYIPAILSAFWWGKKGSTIAFFLGFFLLMSDFYADVTGEQISIHISQIFIFFIATILVGVLSDDRKVSESQLKSALAKKDEFIHETAHYFLNPLSIAYGYMDFLMQECSTSRAKDCYEKIKEALDRIQEAVINTVEKGMIYEHKGDVTLKEKSESQS